MKNISHNVKKQTCPPKYHTSQFKKTTTHPKNKLRSQNKSSPPNTKLLCQKQNISPQKQNHSAHLNAILPKNKQRLSKNIQLIAKSKQNIEK
jgi:hypothetical protein